MKKYLLPFSKSCDISLAWDMNQNKFILNVATNRLPDEECSLKSVATLSDYVSRLQRSLRPIGKSFDGSRKVLVSWEEVVAEAEALRGAGYGIPQNILKQAHEDYLGAQNAVNSSWMEQKKAIKLIKSKKGKK